uniref:Bacterial surface antigen (D15) domain-containing protein n=1 Tax=Oryza meridionalis TaxID=40149 RepID=A0A0E0F1W6_9ORYZ
MVKKQRKVSSGLLKRMAGRIENWYHDEGFQCAQVVSYHGNLDTGEVVCEVVEGDITKVEYQFLDKLGNVVDGNTSIPLIDRELPHQLRPGHIYNNGAGKQALKNIDSLGLFSTIEVQPRPDETNQGGIIVAIKLKEHDPKSAQASILPGGTVSFEHRNICGLKRSLIGSVTSSNLLNPEDDLSFKLEYAHPYLDGVDNRSRNRTFKISCFNSRKLSPIFVAGPNMYEAPPIWVDRIGFKANITEWKRTCDDNNNICTHGSRQLPSGALSMIGPPTTFSGTGVDQMAFLQANITRDNTEFVNGAAIGDRCIFQMGQGLGIGSKNPFFNLRGYGMGELGASRNLLEVATELSLPVTVKNKHTHLRSMALTLGAPTIRVGHGSSYGVGVKLGAVRAEYAVDHNAGTGAFFLRFGSSVDLEVGAHPDVVAGQRVHPCKKERNKQ